MELYPNCLIRTKISRTWNSVAFPDDKSHRVNTILSRKTATVILYTYTYRSAGTVLYTTKTGTQWRTYAIGPHGYCKMNSSIKPNYTFDTFRSVQGKEISVIQKKRTTGYMVHTVAVFKEKLLYEYCSTVNYGCPHLRMSIR